MQRIAIITPCIYPVPDVRGGAVEHLITTLIEQNEKHPCFFFDVYTVSDVNLANINYKFTRILEIKPQKRYSPIRMLQRTLNYICRSINIQWGYAYIGYITKWIKKEKYNFILVENRLDLCFSMRKLYPNAVIYYHLHNDFDLGDWNLTSERMRIAAKQTNGIWVVSNYLKKRLHTISVRSCLLENCLDKNKYNVMDDVPLKSKAIKKKYGIKTDDFLFLYNGRLDKQKGALQAIQAFQIACQRNNKLKLLISANQNGDKLVVRQICTAILENKSISFCGYTCQNDMPALYHAVDAVLIPTQIPEAFGMVALEAISMGKPCVATACGGLLDILDEECAKLIPLGDGYVEKMATAIQELYEDKNMYKQMAAKGIEKAKKFMDEEEYYNTFVNLINGK